ncbi:MAG: inorganic phosphate transporter [Planctomycetes bacterium]|nr:inorganic phosphate transporter [Planctomycetota bacterium]
MDVSLLIVLVVVFALVFDLANGWNDASNAIATVVGTRVMAPWTAIFFGAVLNFAGAMFSSEVAKTVGREIADPALLSPSVFLAAVVIAPAWITLCTLRGLPISCSHSLMGGLVGSVLAAAGPGALASTGIKKIVFGIFTSPVIGFLLGLLVLVLVSWLFRRMSARWASALFGKLQILSAGAMAFSHGTGDAQKAMGMITGALIAGNYIALDSSGMHIPLWVRLSCAAAMGIGSAVGGWAVMRTLGSGLAHLKPYQGFAAETGAATTILVNTLTGVPISTTHSITGAILGVGAARNLKAVRWGVGKKIFLAWVFTFPVCIVGGAVLYKIFHALGL